MRILATFLLFIVGTHALAQSPADSTKDRRWSFHAQATSIWQYHPTFPAKYTGKNSLQTSEPGQISFTGTLYAGIRLWKQAAFYFNPEVAGGSGLSSALGIAGFPNGETFRIGSKQLKVYVARLYLEQKFAIGKGTDWEPDDLNQVQQHTPATYLSIRAGKFSIADFFDDNTYSHDPREQFMNWSLMSNGAWDYPANTRGYTVGAVLEYHTPHWAVRIGVTQVPTYANGPVLDDQIANAHGITTEGEKNIRINKRPGIIRLLLFHNLARMGNYEEAVKNTPVPDIVAVRNIPRSKNGIGISLEQEISTYAGIFVRGSWNDGNNETWAFTEIDHSLSGGIVWDGAVWARKNDELGAAVVVNGISTPHRNYLKAGGYGFIIGDGNLNYSNEAIFEAYYKFRFPAVFLSISPDYQFVLNPAYNKDRGPVHVFGIRAHVQW
ncbi:MULTISPECIES: carbohydrate porin [Niastella]|uniref:Carbohydrate porin n=1 Tax=Niastella soli TaxID=2821487 RepID=A0ABS3Z065_9BACT|nr:carbohydrate porin [Niastella soli]MBO9203565.1 carbohydrate porin [Niastella soli]